MSTDIADSTSFDDPAVTHDQRLATVRALLTRRINSVAQPSPTINQLHATHVRCAHTAKLLEALAGRAPRLLSLIRHALREAFALDPDTLLFSEQPAGHVSSLTDRTLALFRDPGVPINLHHFTALSVRGDPTCVLPFNAREVMARVGRLGLLARINQAVAGYWQQLAPGSWLPRQARWAELHKTLFADQAYLAHQLFQLSDAGYALVKHLVDAPSAEARQRAGGAWATVQVTTLEWPHGRAGSLAIPGALHLSREGAADGPQVIYLPGLQQGFLEFAAWQQVQADLPPRVQATLLSQAWHYLPFERRSPAPLQPGTRLTQDALAHTAQALLEGQWSNEWGCLLSLDYAAPPTAGAPLPSQKVARLLRFVEKSRKRPMAGLPLAPALAQLLEWDHQRRQPQILLASLSDDVPHNAREWQVRRYEAGLTALLAADDPAGSSEAFQQFLQLEQARQEQARLVNRWTQGEPLRLVETDFWLERPDGTRKRATLILNAQRRALQLTAQLEYRAKLIKQNHLDRLLEVLNTPLAAERGNSDTRVLGVTLGADYRLMGVFVVTTARALAEPGLAQPVVLVVSGGFGGLAVFEHLHALSQGLRASLSGRDACVLWRCIGRDVRAAARKALAVSVRVDYHTVDQDVLHEQFKTLIEHHRHLHRQAPTRLFSAVNDPGLARQWLAEELREHLQVPSHEVRSRALANLEFVRFVAGQARHQPHWLVTAAPAERKHYRRLQRRYLASAMALETRLWQVLPPLERFARRLLMAQLTVEGFESLDIDAPLLALPDDVSAHLCGWSSQCVVGDRHIKKTVSAEHTTFSLLELALHNLDPQAPWTEWRLNRARYVQPQWKDRLNPRYLLKTLSTLDIGGQYDTLIKGAFHPASTVLPRRLIERATRQLAQQHLYGAVRQGLSAPAQSLFNTAMAARCAADLHKNGHQISLGLVRLRGYSLKHDRHMAGVLVIIDHLSSRCLVYWPDALGYAPLAEHASLALASAALNRASASPMAIKALAQKVAPGWEADALASYPGHLAPPEPSPVPLARVTASHLPGYSVLSIYESVQRFLRTFKVKHTLPAAAPEAIEAQIKEQIAAEPTAWLEIIPTAHCDPQALLAHARMLEVQQRAHARATSGAMLREYREQRLGEQWDATVRGLLSFVPVIGLGISLYELLLAARRLHLSGRPEDAVDVAFMTLMTFIDVLSSFLPTSGAARSGGLRRGLRPLHRHGNGLTRLPPAPRPTTLLERFRKPFSTDGAVALQGPGEKGVYVKSGELFLVDGEHRYPLYRRGDEQTLRVQSAEGEWVLTVREDREWSLGADAPPASPQPGPSSAIWRPFPAPATTAWRPPSRGGVQQRLRQTYMPFQQFQAWAISTPLTLTQWLPEHGIFEAAVSAPVQPYRVLQHNGRHFRLLPQGSDVSARELIFISRDQPLEYSAALDVAYWLEVGAFDQPIPASFGEQGQWTFHRPLFGESLRVSLSRAFPSMTANSRTFLIARLLELSDPSPQLTATHLLNLRATLDQWLAPNALGQTDDLLRLLRPLDSNTRTSLFIGTEPSTPGFDRVDFTLRQRPHMSLREPGQQNLFDRSAVLQNAVRRVLEEQGFSLRTLEKRAGSGGAVDFYCTHPQSTNLYYVMTRWAHTASIKLDAAHALQLTDEWFVHKSLASKQAARFAPVKRALDEGRLVKIIAGVQWTPTAPPTVFFVKFGSLKPGTMTPRPPRRKRPRLPD